MKRRFLILTFIFILSNLFSQITDDSRRPFDPSENLLVKSLDYAIRDTSTGTDENRELLGYNIYLDGAFIGFFDEFFIEMLYYLLTPGQTYIFGVEAVYTGGAGLYFEFIFIYNPALNSAEDFFVTDNGFASWDPPVPADDNRELLGYNVYLNVDFITFTTNEYYQYDTSGLVAGQPYVGGVTAVYDEGESTSKICFFLYLMTNPMIEVNPDEISVTLEPDELTYEELTVSNPGSDVLFFEIDVNYLTDDSWILINTALMYSLEAGESSVLSIPISSAGFENVTKTAELIFENNAGPDVIIPVTMVVNPLPYHNPPSNAGYELFSDHIHLFWEPPVNTTLNVIEYHIYVDGVMYTTTELFFDIYNLIVGQVYDIALTALYEDQIESDPIIFNICFLRNDGIINFEKPNLVNYPNPFNPSTTISFSLTAKDAQDAKIEIFNLKGQKVKTFSNLQITQSTNQKIVWNGKDENGEPVASGVYYCRMKCGEYQTSKKMVLLK
ncbi:MAG: T9SS type A sorting domain-containing protein [Candidatus Cloacimonadales bacterium]|nr:T9SS type A sorting domain-containing protein [Candidatus Cloacimonadales bacterium]